MTDTELLESIDRSLKALVAHFGAGQTTQAAQPATNHREAPRVAPDSDLDSEWGDPEIKTKDPRDWTGVPMRGRRFSECSVQYLGMYAEFLDWMGDQSEENGQTDSKGRPVAPYKRKDAARARGWAARLRAGWTPPAEPTGFPSDVPAPVTDDDIPF